MGASEFPGIDDYPETLPLPDGDELVLIGWAGAKVDLDDPACTEIGYDPKGPDEGVRLKAGQSAWWSEADGTWFAVDHGEWYLRAAGDQGDLVAPWPIYGRRSDAAARGFEF